MKEFQTLNLVRYDFVIVNLYYLSFFLFVLIFLRNTIPKQLRLKTV